MPCPRERTIGSLLAILLLSFGLGPSSSAFGQKRSDPQPELLIDRSRHNFGEVFAGEVLSCVFNVRNGGGRSLKLSEPGEPLPPSTEKPPSEPSAAMLKAPVDRSASLWLEPLRTVDAAMTASHSVVRIAAAAPS